MVERPVIVVISDLKFDPDLGDDLGQYHELHELECVFVQLRAKEAARQLARAGLRSQVIPFVEGATSLDGRCLDQPLVIPGLDLSDVDVLVVAPVIYCTRDERFYIRAAANFEDHLLNLPTPQAVTEETAGATAPSGSRPCSALAFSSIMRSCSC